MNNTFEWMMFHLLESTLTTLALLLFLYLFQVRESKIRSWFLRICLLKFLVPTVLIADFFKSTWRREAMPTLEILVVPVQGLVQTAASSGFEDYPMILWWVGAISIFLIGMINTVRMHSRILSDRTPLTGKALRILEELQQTKLPKHRIPGDWVHIGPSIALYGIFRPRIIAKRAFIETLEDEELVFAFQHELEHWKRKDTIWRLIVEGIVCVFWFHPLVWYLRKQLLLETEKSCDESVLQQGTSPSGYANCLLKAAEYSHETNYYGAMALSETSLKRRVSNVIKYQKETMNKMKLTAVILTSSLMLAGSFLIAGEGNGSQETGNSFSVKEVDQAPVPTHQIAPVYPADLKAQKITGKVLVVFVVDESGNVVNAKAKKSSHPGFETSAVEALKQWSFKPGKKDGKPVRVAMTAPILFELDTFWANLQKLRSSDDPDDKAFLAQLEKKLKALKEMDEDERQRLKPMLEKKLGEYLALKG